MVLSIIMTILGAGLLFIGIIGCIIPAIPGPIFAFLALILISIPGDWLLYAPWLLVLLGVLAVATMILDNVLPAVSSKKAGAGKAGVWGSIVGMIAGSFFLPPFGTIIGAFVGALLGEILFNKENKEPLKAAIGVFKGTMLAILMKLLVAGVTGFYFVRGAIALFRA